MAKDTTEAEIDDTATDTADIESSFEDIDDDETFEDDTADKDVADDSDDEEPEEDSSDEETAEEKVEEVDKEDAKDEPSEEDKQKALNREQAEKRIKEREERDAAVKAQQKDQDDKYLDEAETPEQLALRKLEIDAYNQKVERNTDKLTTQYERAIKDFDILSDPNPIIQAELKDALDAFQAQHVTMDTYGNPAELKADLYAVLQRKADSIKQLAGIGARAQTDSKDKQRSKTLPSPTRAPKTPKKDEGIDGFDEEAGRY